MKLFTWAGDNDTLQLWKANGFRAVPLAATDILTGLQTGLIDAVPTTPLYALLNQSFGIAHNMIDGPTRLTAQRLGHCECEPTMMTEGFGDSG